jgi:hypothetical protein
MSERIIHTVCAGECMASIAGQYGFFWETLWNHSDNASLKNERKNPNILMEGDRVVVPAKRSKEESAATEARHRFKRKGVPSKFRLRLLAFGQPRANLDYACEIDGQWISGQTDSDGLVSFSVPPGAKKGTLRLGGEGGSEEYEVVFGQLNPISDVSGAQQRLHNLGYDCEATGTLDDQTRAALACFRADQNLADSDELDEEARNALVQAHGT